MKIAVIDDSRLLLEVTKGYFDKFRVNDVDYFQESLKFIESDKKYDLYLIDLVMPKYYGEDLIYHIREKDQDAIIIIITTYGENNSIYHCLSIGANDKTSEVALKAGQELNLNLKVIHESRPGKNIASRIISRYINSTR